MCKYTDSYSMIKIHAIVLNVSQCISSISKATIIPYIENKRNIILLVSQNMMFFDTTSCIKAPVAEKKEE